MKHDDIEHDGHVEASFSDLLDGALGHSDLERVRAHVAACPACSERYDSFARSTRALQRLPIAATPPEHVSGVLAALGAELSAERPAPRRVAGLLSHAAALLVGLGLAFGLRGCASRIPPEGGSVEPQVVEVVREIPVEIPVEVVREVPVERVEYVDRPVPSPLQLDAEQGARLLTAFAEALSELARVAGAESARRNAAADRSVQELAQAQSPDAGSIESPSTVLGEDAPSRSLRIQRSGGSVLIRTRGAMADVVPALIDTLGDPDVAVARAAELHLAALRAEFGGTPDVASPAGQATQESRHGGFRGLLASARTEPQDEPAVDSHARWTRWWLEQSASTGSY